MGSLIACKYWQELKFRLFSKVVNDTGGADDRGMDPDLEDGVH